MTNELTKPHRMSVTPSASATGQAVGSGSLSGLGWLQPGRKPGEEAGEFCSVFMLYW